jgi:hypothetical protein
LWEVRILQIASKWNGAETEAVKLEFQHLMTLSVLIVV